MYHILGINHLKMIREWESPTHPVLDLSHEYEVILKNNEGLLQSCYLWARKLLSCSGTHTCSFAEYSLTEVNMGSKFDFITTYQPKEMYLVESLPPVKFKVGLTFDSPRSSADKEEDLIHYSERGGSYYYPKGHITLLKDTLNEYFEYIVCRSECPQMYIGASEHKDLNRIFSTDPDIYLTADLRGKSLDQSVFKYQSILIEKDQLKMLNQLKKASQHNAVANLELILDPALL